MLTLPAVLTHAVAVRFLPEISGGMATDPDQVVVDAGALDQFDSSALALLLECRRQAMAAGKAFSVHGAPARLLQLAEVYGVAALIPAMPAGVTA